MIAGGTMDNPAAWDADAGWQVSGGVATHSPGVADAIGQAQSLTAGKWYRIGFTVSSRAAGSVTPRLVGGSTRAGDAVSTNGEHSARIEAASGNNRIEFVASSDFDGAIDNVMFYQETTACLAPGTHYLWIEPQNADTVPGPVAGPFTVTII